MSKNEMIMLPREVVRQALAALDAEDPYRAAVALRLALDQPQPDPAPYLWYDPHNGDTWTREAINDGCCPPDGLIALYTKETK